MQSVLRNVRVVVFGAAVLGSLGFGASQAVASPVAKAACNGPGQVFLGTCPGPGGDCSAYCSEGSGVCRNGCCTCPI